MGTMPSAKSLANLKPFTGGPDPRHQPGRGRPSPLNDPEWVELFARALAEGLTNDQISDEFDISTTSVKKYKRDPRVKAAALKSVEDRILRVTRRTDTKIDLLVSGPKFDALDVQDQIMLLLKVRKEYLGGVLRLQAESGKVDSGTVNEAMDAMESDPAWAAEMRKLLERSPSTKA